MQLATDTGFAQPDFSDTLAGATINFGPLAAGPYYWRVRGEYAALGWGPWSDTRSFGVGVFSIAFGGLLEERGPSLSMAHDGGYLVAGRTQSFGAGGSDIFLVRTDSLGDLLWQGAYGGASFDWGEASLTSQAGGFIIVGSSKLGLAPHELVALQVNDSGELDWISRFGIAGKDMFGVAIQDWDLQLVLVSGIASVDGQSEAAHLLNFDGSGAVGWQSELNTTNPLRVRNMIRILDDGYVLSGQCRIMAESMGVCLVKVNRLGVMEWLAEFAPISDYADSHDLGLLPDGGYVLAASSHNPDGGLLLKIDASGQEVWRHLYQEGVPSITAVALTPDLGYFLAAATSPDESTGGLPLFIKVDDMGQEIWRRNAGGNHYRGEIHTIRQTAGGYIIAGTTWPTRGAPRDLWLMKTNRELEFPMNVALRRLLDNEADVE